jgi:predicted metal-dependent hydrolase
MKKQRHVKKIVLNLLKNINEISGNEINDVKNKKQKTEYGSKMVFPSFTKIDWSMDNILG